MKSQRDYFYSALFILILAWILFLKNLFLAVRIEDGIGTLWIDYAGLFFFLISLLFFSKSLIFTISLFLFINIFDSLMLFSNRIYYRYFGDYITFDLFSLAGNIPFTWENIVNLVRFKDILLFFDIPFLIFLPIFLLKKIKLSLKRRFLFAVLSLLIGISLTTINLFLLHKTLPYVITFRYGSSMLFNSMSVHNFYILNIFQEGIKKEKIDFIPTSFPSELISNQELDSKFKVERKLWNIIIVEFESLGAEIIGKKIDGQEITPTLNRLAEKGIYFKNFYSQALTCSGTLDVELSTLSSFYPSPKSPYAIKYAKKIPFTLPRFLKIHGYRTMFFHANSGDFYRRSIVMRIFGFESLYFADYFNSNERKHRGTDDYPFFLECAEVIKNSSQPFFAYIVTLSSHTPFDLPKGEKPGLEIRESLDETTKKYYQILNYVDRAFKAFFEELSKYPLIKDTILILFGDHTRTIPESKEGEIGVINQSIKNRVPLIILIPDSDGFVVNEPASHVDITPTILSILGLKSDSILLGRNLLSEKGEGFVLINRNPVILIKKENVFWGLPDKGFDRCLNLCSKKELSDANRYLEIIKYSEFILKK